MTKLTGMQPRDPFVCWMSLEKALSRKVSLSSPPSQTFHYLLCDIVYSVTVFYNVSDGIGLLGGAINHFVSCDDPPKV